MASPRRPPSSSQRAVHSAARSINTGFAVFLLAQLVVTPMMGGGVFSGGNMRMLVGSLLGHLVYGALVGAVYAGGAKTGEVARA